MRRVQELRPGLARGWLPHPRARPASKMGSAEVEEEPLGDAEGPVIERDLSPARPCSFSISKPDAYAPAVRLASTVPISMFSICVNSRSSSCSEREGLWGSLHFWIHLSRYLPMM